MSNEKVIKFLKGLECTLMNGESIDPSSPLHLEARRMLYELSEEAKTNVRTCQCGDGTGVYHKLVHEDSELFHKDIAIVDNNLMVQVARQSTQIKAWRIPKKCSCHKGLTFEDVNKALRAAQDAQRAPKEEQKVIYEHIELRKLCIDAHVEGQLSAGIPLPRYDKAKDFFERHLISSIVSGYYNTRPPKSPDFKVEGTISGRVTLDKCNITEAFKK
jgi:hypothetical protein